MRKSIKKVSKNFKKYQKSIMVSNPKKSITEVQKVSKWYFSIIPGSPEHNYYV